jgi:hypothetical protein
MLGELIGEIRAVAKERLSRLKRRAITVSAAAGLFALAFLFALLGIFILLQEQIGAPAAAFVLFALLGIAGAVALIMGRERRPRVTNRQLPKPLPVQQSTAEQPLTSSGWPLILTAFAAGIALSRTRFNGWRKRPLRFR